MDISQFQLHPCLTHPPPPLLRQLLDIAHLVSPEGGALANLALPRGQAFAIP